MRQVATAGVSGLVIGGAGGAVVGGATGYMFGYFSLAALAHNMPDSNAKKLGRFTGSIGAVAGSAIGALWLGATAFTTTAAVEIIVNAPQNAVNLANSADSVVNKLSQGDVSPGTVKQLILVGVGAYALFKAVQWAAPVVRDTVFGAAPRH